MISALPSASGLAKALAEHVDALVPELLSSARRSGGYWSAGNVEGDVGNSLYVHRAGPKAGKWADAATGQFGDALDLINFSLFGGQDLRAAIRWAWAWLGLDPKARMPKIPPRASRPRPDGDEAAIGAARGIWSTGKPIPGTVAELYLRRRAIDLDPLPPSLRFAPALMHYLTGLALPALIAAISGQDGKVSAIQRIYLRLDGTGKAAVSDPKLTLGRLRDGACRLAPAGRELGLAEGIETALSAMELYRMPVWAACGSRMDAIAVPSNVRRLVVFADNGSAGERAAEPAAAAHERGGRSVAIVYPPTPAKDFNDLSQADAAGGEAA